MTPVPMILVVLGILNVSRVLPNRILVWRVPPTAPWRRARMIIGVAAIISGGFWLALDLTLQSTGLADMVGWISVAVAAAVCVRLIASQRSTVRPN